MTTFGGKQVWTTKEDEWFPFTFVVEKNDGYMLVQSGLNYYVFESSKILKLGMEEGR